MALTRDDIVSTAVRLLEQNGLEGLSLRKIAAELGVSAPTLYWHVESKRELLDLLAEHLMRDRAGGHLAEPAPGQHWSAWLTDLARATFTAMTSHRDAPLIVAGNRPTPQSLPSMERMIAVLVDGGIPPGEAIQVLFAVQGYVGGCALEWQAEAARQESGRGEAELREAIGDAAQFPHLVAAFQELHRLEYDATFELGLGLLIDGLRARYPD